MGLCHCKKSDGISSVADSISDANSPTLWLHWLSHSQWQPLNGAEGETGSFEKLIQHCG